MKPPYVTHHAVLRWWERVYDIDVESFRRDLAAIEDRPVAKIRDCDLVDWLLAYFETDWDAVTGLICTDVVRTAWKAGAKFCLIDGANRVFEGDYIVSIYNGSSRKPKHKTRRGKSPQRKRTIQQIVEDQS